MKKSILIFPVFAFCLSIASCGLQQGNYHTVVWLNYDNTLLYKDKKVEDGTMPVYKGEDPTKPAKDKGTGYLFTGWSPEVVPAYVDATYVATYVERAFYKLSVNSSNSKRGSVSILSGSGFDGETIVVEAYPEDDFIFVGWYSGNSFVSSKEKYTFTMPSNNYSLTARFLDQTALEQEKASGLYPVFNDAKKTVTYGIYPQKIINDSSITSNLNKASLEGNGWYLYNDKYYAKIGGRPYFNGTSIVYEPTYWYECEPITWNILSIKGNEYYLLSSVILNAKEYGTGNTSYEESIIREWLNEDFYNSAFYLNKSFIKADKNKVSLPTTNDYRNSSYGFDSEDSISKTRECKPTDYAKEMGVLYDPSDPDYPDTSPYWTRTRESTYVYNLDNGYIYFYAYCIGVGGGINLLIADNEQIGVRPCITLIY